MENEDSSLDVIDNSALDIPSDNFNDNWFDSGISGGSPMDKHSDLLKELTNFDPIIQKRIRNWLGLEWDDTVKEYRQKREAVINERGARWAMGWLQTYQSKTNFITNITQNEFKNIQIDIIKIAWLVFPTIDEFGVKSTQDWYRLCTELDNSAFLVLAGAGDGKYTKFFGESITRNETVNLTPPTQQPNNSPRPGLIANIKNKIFGR